MEDFVIVISVGRPYDIASEDPVKERMPVDFYERAKAQGLPATAKVVYGMKNSGGKQTLFIKGLDFVGAKPSK